MTEASTDVRRQSSGLSPLLSPLLQAFYSQRTHIGYGIERTASGIESKHRSMQLLAEGRTSDGKRGRFLCEGDTASHVLRAVPLFCLGLFYTVFPGMGTAQATYKCSFERIIDQSVGCILDVAPQKRKG